jgi:hypothetical protein
VAIDIGIDDVEEVDGDVDVLGGFRDAKSTGKKTLAGKTKSAPASSSGGKKLITKQSASSSKPRKPKNADAMLADVQDESARAIQAMIEEKKRHNQQKEAGRQQKEVDRQKKEADRHRRAEQREQASAMSYNMQLYDNFRKLKADGMPDNQIIELFPDMKKFITLD